jgi:hypothetical protein
MKTIIFQHYTGVLSEIAKLSINNMKKYATRIGSEYKFLEGNVYHPGMSPPCQKMHMLSPLWDEYDYTLMVDTDMFAVKGLTENIFTDVNGVGLMAYGQKLVFRRCSKKFPDLTCAKYPYFGGAVWRLSRDQRMELREHINLRELIRFSKNFEDEGMIHRLMTLASVRYSPIPQRWCYCSYLPNPDSAAFIHIRNKIKNDPKSPRRTKLENYEVLKEKGILE